MHILVFKLLENGSTMGVMGHNGARTGPKWDIELMRQVGVHSAGVFGARFNGDVQSTHFGLSTV